MDLRWMYEGRWMMYEGIRISVGYCTVSLCVHGRLVIFIFDLDRDCDCDPELAIDLIWRHGDVDPSAREREERAWKIEGTE